jgi:hypothetical protein
MLAVKVYVNFKVPACIILFGATPAEGSNAKTCVVIILDIFLQCIILCHVYVKLRLYLMASELYVYVEIVPLSRPQPLLLICQS